MSKKGYNRGNSGNGSNKHMPSLHDIEMAVKGDVTAINKVLKYFEGYIIALSTRPLFDEDGNPHFVIDNEKRRAIETRLITGILKFDVTRTA